MIEEIRNIKSGKKELRNFGFTIGIVLLLIAGVLFYKNNNLFISFAYIAVCIYSTWFPFSSTIKTNLFYMDDICSGDRLDNDQVDLEYFIFCNN